MGASQAYCTLLYNDAYLPGALVLAQALKAHGTEHQLVVLVGSQVSDDALHRLSKVFDQVIPTETIANSHADAAQFKLLGRPELERTYTKIHVWRQTQFQRIVFLDADTLPLQNLDHLFDLTDGLDASTPIAACPDIGWPDIFNSGVFVTIPNNSLYNTLVGRARAGLSFDGGDQGLLNQFFENRWQRLPFTYNVTPSASYQYTPAYQHFKHKVNIVHFIGSQKPWSHSFTGPWHDSSEFEVQWWNLYNTYYDANLNLRSEQQQLYQQYQEQQHHQQHYHHHEQHYHSPQQEQHDDHDVHESHSGKAGVTQAEQHTYFHTQISEPPPVYHPPPTVEADINRWDATRFQPPRDSKPEAENLVIEHFQNVWDEPSKQQPAEPHHPIKEGEPQQPSYAPDPQLVKRIFPWEFTETPKTPERVFPEELEYDEEEEVQEEEHYEEHQETTAEGYHSEPVQDASHPVETRDLDTFQPEVQAEPEFTGPPPQRQFRDYAVAPSPAAPSRFMNAWDGDNKIQRYVNQSIYLYGFRPHGSRTEDEEEEESGQESEDDGVGEGIDEAQKEVAANMVVRKKIAEQDDSGIIMKKQPPVLDQRRTSKSRLFPVTPNPIKLRSEGLSGGLSDASDGPDDTADEDEKEDVEADEAPVKATAKAKAKALVLKEEKQDEEEEETAKEEDWDPHAKLAELAQLSALIVAKQVEFEKKYKEKFGNLTASLKKGKKPTK